MWWTSFPVSCGIKISSWTWNAVAVLTGHYTGHKAFFPWVQTTTNSAGFTNKCIKTIKIIMNVELWPKFMLSVKLVRLHVKPACPHKWLWDFLPLHSDLHLGVLVLVWVYLEALCLFVSSQQSLGWLLPKKKIPIKLTVITSLKNI